MATAAKELGSPRVPTARPLSFPPKKRDVINSRDKVIKGKINENLFNFKSTEINEKTRRFQSRNIPCSLNELPRKELLVLRNIRSIIVIIKIRIKGQYFLFLMSKVNFFWPKKCKRRSIAMLISASITLGISK